MSENSQPNVTGTKLSIYPDTVSNVSSIHPNFYLFDTVLAHQRLTPRQIVTKGICTNYSYRTLEM